MGIINETLESIKHRRQRILEGNVNCIESPFKRFSEDFVGIEQQTYYITTSFTKGSKTQFTSYTFIFESLLKSYFTKKFDFKVLYFPLEETPERITQRFMSYLLCKLSHNKLRVSPKELRSTKEALSQEVIDLLESEEYLNILKFYETNVIFYTEGFNPTGIYKRCKQYAEEHGKTLRTPIEIEDEFGNKTTINKFDKYIPDNPNEYRLIVIDTINLIDLEKGLNKKQSIDKMSEYIIKFLRDRYKFSIVVIQQQNTSTENNDSVKLGRYTPSKSGLADSTYTANDANIMLGIFSPMKFGLTEYMGYDIKRFKDNIRFVTVETNRDGEMGGSIALFFDGATCQFFELPRPDDKEALEKVYKYLDNIRGKNNKIFLWFNKLKLFNGTANKTKRSTKLQS